MHPSPFYRVDSVVWTYRLQRHYRFTGAVEAFIGTGHGARHHSKREKSMTVRTRIAIVLLGLAQGLPSSNSSPSPSALSLSNPQFRIKPVNVLLTDRGPKILDFGLAKTTTSSAAGAGVSQLATILFQHLLDTTSAIIRSLILSARVDVLN